MCRREVDHVGVDGNLGEEDSAVDIETHKRWEKVSLPCRKGVEGAYRLQIST